MYIAFTMPEYPIPYHVRQTTRARSLAMDRFDEAVFSFALLERFEGVRFEWSPPGNRNPPVATELLCEPADGFYSLIHVPFVSDLDGEPDELTVRLERSRWIFSGPGSDRWMCNLPTLGAGRLGTSWRSEDREAKRMADRVWRLFQKVATNRYHLWHEDIRDEKSNPFLPSDLWAGHHALKWCQSKERNMFDGNSWASKEWQAPDTEWHRTMQAKVIERFGADFGQPPTEPPSGLPEPANIRLG